VANTEQPTKDNAPRLTINTAAKLTIARLTTSRSIQILAKGPAAKPTPDARREKQRGRVRVFKGPGGRVIPKWA
jgi:hypothetical protein